MMPFMTDSFGNPSSAHLAGREPKAAVERARESVAELLGAASPAEIAFTSCGTERDNWAVARPKPPVGRAGESVAELLGAASPAEIAFTSCGTESDNWAILGSL